MAGSAPRSPRTVALLDFLASRPTEAFSLSELARRLELNKSTTHAMLTTLADAGYVTRHPVEKSYTLGPSLVALGEAATASPSVDIAQYTIGEMRRDGGRIRRAVRGEPHHGYRDRDHRPHRDAGAAGPDVVGRAPPALRAPARHRVRRVVAARRDRRVAPAPRAGRQAHRAGAVPTGDHGSARARVLDRPGSRRPPPARARGRRARPRRRTHRRRARPRGVHPHGARAIGVVPAESGCGARLRPDRGRRDGGGHVRVPRPPRCRRAHTRGEPRRGGDTCDHRRAARPRSRCGRRPTRVECRDGDHRDRSRRSRSPGRRRRPRPRRPGRRRVGGRSRGGVRAHPDGRPGRAARRAADRSADRGRVPDRRPLGHRHRGAGQPGLRRREPRGRPPGLGRRGPALVADDGHAGSVL